MIIKIGNAAFDTNGDYPVMLILTKDEIKTIANMEKGENSHICFAPSGWDDEKINKWMDGK